MSFGISVGDFITVTDKAFMIYKRCRDAPITYADLAHHVEVLHQVLQNTTAYIKDAEKDDQIPKSEEKQEGLVLARMGCDKTLDEVDRFLKKFTDMQKSKRRVIETWKFIKKDTEGMQTKLRNNTELLQLSLVSLTSLSVSHMKRTLDVIVKEYQTGAHQATVLSRPICDDQIFDGDELFEQVTADLEDKDVHPDSIALNKSYLLSWLSKVIAEGGLDEVPPDIEPQAKENNKLDVKTDNESTQRGAPGDEAGSLQNGENLPKDINEGVVAPLDEHASVHSSRPVSVSSHSSQPNDWHPFDRPDDGFVRSMLDPLFTDAGPPPESERAIRRISRAFCQKDWGRKGYLTRKEVVQTCKLWVTDTTNNALERMVMSYDVDQNGRIEKNEFVSLFQQLLKLSAGKVRRTRDVEAEKATSMARAEFEGYVSRARSQIKERRITNFDRGKLRFVPWGWIPGNKRGSSVSFMDKVRRREVISSVPPGLREPYTFSIMAEEADRAEAAIGQFQQQWITTVPESLQNQYLEVLNTVRKTAVEFTVFENKKNRQLLSDLDAFMQCFLLVTRTRNDFLDMPGHDSLVKAFQYLQKARPQFRGLLRNIQGFALSLSSFSDSDFETPAHESSKFCKKWEQLHKIWPQELISGKWSWDHEEAAANATSESPQEVDRSGKSDWDSMKAVISDIRESCYLNILEPLALEAAKTFQTGTDKLVKALAEVPWHGQLISAEVSGWKTKWPKAFDTTTVYLQIDVDCPLQSIKTKPMKRGANMSWEERIPINLMHSSTLTFSIRQFDKDSSKNGLCKFRFEPPTRLTVEVLESYGTDIFIGNIHTMTPSITYTYPIKYGKEMCPTLNLHMQLKDRKALWLEITTLNKLDWTYFMDLGNPDPLRKLALELPPNYEAKVTADGGLAYVNRKTGAEFLVRSITTNHELKRPYHILPNGFEERTTMGGRIYYMHHPTKTTSWVRPEEPPANETNETSIGTEKTS